MIVAKAAAAGIQLNDGEVALFISCQCFGFLGYCTGIIRNILALAQTPPVLLIFALLVGAGGGILALYPHIAQIVGWVVCVAAADICRCGIGAVQIADHHFVPGDDSLLLFLRIQ